MLTLTVGDGIDIRKNMSDGSELNALLNRRQNRNDMMEQGQKVSNSYRVVNVYTEFAEFSRKQIKEYETAFKQ